MHLKRSELPKEWPIPRKGTKYIKTFLQNKEKSIPLLIILRDVLKLVKTKREAKKVCLNGEIKINGKVRKEIDFPVFLRDVISIEKISKNYRLVLKNKKFQLEEISEKETKEKIVKVIGKRLLKGKRIQANLEDGTNILTNENFSNGDSFIISLPERKLLKIIPLKENSKVEIIKGKYKGMTAKIKDIELIGEKKMFKVKFDNGGEALLPKEVLLAIE